MPPGVHPFHIFVSFQLIERAAPADACRSRTAALSRRASRSPSGAATSRGGRRPRARALPHGARRPRRSRSGNDGARRSPEAVPDLRSRARPARGSPSSEAATPGRSTSRSRTNDETYWDKIPLPGKRAAPGWQLAFGAAKTPNRQPLGRRAAREEARWGIYISCPSAWSLGVQEWCKQVRHDAAAVRAADAGLLAPGVQGDGQRTLYVRGLTLDRPAFDYLDALAHGTDAVRVDKPRLRARGSSRQPAVRRRSKVIARTRSCSRRLAFGMDFGRRRIFGSTRTYST